MEYAKESPANWHRQDFEKVNVFPLKILINMLT